MIAANPYRIEPEHMRLRGLILTLAVNSIAVAGLIILVIFGGQ